MTCNSCCCTDVTSHRTTSRDIKPRLASHCTVLPRGVTPESLAGYCDDNCDVADKQIRLQTNKQSHRQTQTTDNNTLSTSRCNTCSSRACHYDSSCHSHLYARPRSFLAQFPAVTRMWHDWPTVCLSVCGCPSCEGPEDKCSSWRWRDGLSTTQYVLNDVSSRCTTTTRQTAIIDDHSASHNRLSAPTHTTHCLDMTSFWDTDNETVYRIREMTFNITQCHPSTTLDHLDFLSETRTVGNSCLQIILSEMTLKVIRGHWCRQTSVCHITSNSIIGSGLW